MCIKKYTLTKFDKRLNVTLKSPVHKKITSHMAIVVPDPELWYNILQEYGEH